MLCTAHLVVPEVCAQGQTDNQGLLSQVTLALSRSFSKFLIHCKISLVMRNNSYALTVSVVGDVRAHALGWQWQGGGQYNLQAHTLYE